MPENIAYKKNIHWINYVKAICMIVIYYTHAQGFFKYTVLNLAKYLTPFYVNAFFFVSGYLFFRKQIPLLEENDYLNLRNERKRFLQNLLFRLVIPVLLFSVIEFVPASLVQGRVLSVMEFIEKTVWGGTYWFVSALVVAELLVLVLTLTGIKNIFFYLACSAAFFYAGRCMVLSGWIMMPSMEINPWYIEKGLLASLFLAVGGLYWKYEEQIDRVLKWYAVLPLLAVYIVLEYTCHDSIAIGIASGAINTAGALVSILSSVLLIRICKTIRKTNIMIKLLENIGIYSIGFYFVCGAIPKLMVKVMPRFFPEGTLLYMLIGFVGSFVLAYVAVMLMNRFLPFLFDLRAGFQIQNRTGPGQTSK